MLDPTTQSPRQIAWSLVQGLLVVGVVVVLIAVFFRAPMEAASSWFVGRFGLGAVFAAGLLLDALPGFGSQPIVLLACAGGLPPLWVWLAAAVGSWLSGSLGWAVGTRLTAWGALRRWMARVGLEKALLKHGRRAIFFASLAPVPYGLVTLAAGACGVAWLEVGVGATGRFFKVGLNVAVVALGWGFTA